MSTKAFRILAIIVVFIYVGCQADNPHSAINYSITSPKTDWSYYSDAKIVLALNIDTQEISWRSSVDGYLGKGNHLLVFLSPGNHTITTDVLGIEKAIDITVFEKNVRPEVEIKTLINYSPLERRYPNGKHYPYLITLDGSIKGFKKEGNINEDRAVGRGQQGFVTRDIRFATNGKPLIAARNKARSLSLNNSNPEIGEKQVFYVPNTSLQYALPHEVPAVLFYTSDKLNVWVPEFESIDETLLLDCVLTVENSILLRLQQIWGNAADINEDGRLAILVSKTINDEGVAIGFFNPADFYKREADITHDAYNPASNEMDIIYIAAPDDTSTSYSKESITATIAHELTHAISYTQKTWQREIMGMPDVKREELFLDEGLSHLSEVLCGIGYSGGTVKYLQRYLENTAYYSVCGKNIYGQETVLA